MITDGIPCPYVVEALILSGLRTQVVYEKVTGADLTILRELGPRGGRALLAGHERIVPT